MSHWITRRQLHDWGASVYLARRLTRDLPAADRPGRALAYEARAIVAAIDRHAARSTVPPQTRDRLAALKAELLRHLGVSTFNRPPNGRVAKPEPRPHGAEKSAREFKKLKIRQGKFDESDLQFLEACFQV